MTVSVKTPENCTKLFETTSNISLIIRALQNTTKKGLFEKQMHHLQVEVLVCLVKVQTLLVKYYSNTFKRLSSNVTQVFAFESTQCNYVSLLYIS